jgi:hypothetical protein
MGRLGRYCAALGLTELPAERAQVERRLATPRRRWPLPM